MASISVLVSTDAVQTSQIGSRFRVSTDNVIIASLCGTVNCATDREIKATKSGTVYSTAIANLDYILFG